MKPTIDTFKDAGITVVLRKIDHMIPIVEALHAGGIQIVEVTADNEDADRIIEELAIRFGDSLFIGGGTVLDPSTAERLIDAGASFIVSPVVDVPTIETSKKLGALSVPGAFTPTEIYTAHVHGADMVKVFPASTLGPAFVKDVRGPLPKIPLMVTGGITLNNMVSFLKAGAHAVGVGGSLVPKVDQLTDDYLQDLKERAGQYVQTFAEYRRPFEIGAR